MDFKNNFIKKINKLSHFGVLAIGFIIGLLVMYLHLQPKLVNQEKIIRDWINVANKNKQEANIYQKEWFSATSKLDPNPLLLIPTATQQPVDPHAGMKELKGMNCQSQNNGRSSDCSEYDYWYDPNKLPSQPEQFTSPNPEMGQ